MRRLSGALPLVAVCAAAIGGSAEPLQLPRFDVASVRLASPASPASRHITDTRIDLVNVTLRSILVSAFRVKDYELVAPTWLNDVRVDIHATIPPGSMRSNAPEMLQQLLAERFALATHRESRLIDAYELTVGPSGVKMLEAEPVSEAPNVSSAASPQRGRETVVESWDGPITTVGMPGGGIRTVTSQSLYERRANRVTGGMFLDATRMGMAELASLLSQNMDEPVVDRTGLSGLFRFKVELPPDASLAREMSKAGLSPAAIDAATKGSGLSTPKAMETLGLRLERRTIPREVLVIDSVNRTPSPN